MEKRTSGYVLIMLLFVLTVMGIGLLVAVPVWETQIRREREEELIFRGNQYVQAIRIFQLKNPGTFPKTLEELIEEKCIRRLYKDPMNPEGDWNIILVPEPGLQGGGLQRRPQTVPLRPGQSSPREQGQVFSAQSVLVAPKSALPSLGNPQIIGVVSSSTLKSFRVYHDQERYDKWLFFYGQDSKQQPEIIYYGQSSK
jgi:type II secretory pathway pseudopilin PulG